ncbi:MAG: ankyrin repeat domain-containing protein [Phycisphaeraceae bacterium]|nr:ankyrin repeat domain-containing protein [Phycisphaeraceae bacterium]
MADSQPLPSARPLPQPPNLDKLKKEAKRLLEAIRAGDPAALARLTALRLPRDGAALHNAQLILAREHGFPSWRALKAYVEAARQATQDIDHRVIEMVRAGNASALFEILKAHPNKIHATGGPWQQPLLHLAATAGHLAVVNLLLERGLDVNTRDRADNASALHFAAENGHLPVVQRLLDAGGDLHQADNVHELDVLGWATCLGGYHQDVANLLLERCARLGIFTAVAMDRGDDVRRIIEADPSQRDRQMSRNEHHQRPLHLAVAKNRPRMVPLLLELGADPHAQTRAGVTPLGLTNARTDPAIIESLRRHGASFSLVDALLAGRFDEAQRLLNEQPDRLRTQDSHAIVVAAEKNRTASVRWLIDHGADVNTLAETCCTTAALHHAAARGNTEMVRMLLAAGADRDLRDGLYDKTPPQWAEFYGKPETAELIRTWRS